MRGEILYERSTTLPNIRGHFSRPRIDKLLNEQLGHQLIAVIAGAGWGKTHAIAAFLKSANVRAVWFQLWELDNHLDRFWEQFIYIIASQNKESAAEFQQLGFPETYVKFNKFLHILAKEIYSHEQYVIVFDDFHLIFDEQILRFIDKLIYAKLENFSVIINCRGKLPYNLTAMVAKGLAGQITTEDLRFTAEETEAYLKEQGISLPSWGVDKVRRFTEGWPLALYLVGLSIKKGGVLLQESMTGAIPLIFEMIENEIFSAYTPPVQNFIIRVSLLSFFHYELIKELAGEHFDGISEILESSMFVCHNPYTGYYNLHHLFLEFLREKQRCLTEEEITDTYLKAARWCLRKDLKIEALAYYDKCGQYDKILEIMSRFGTAIFSKTIGEFYISLIDNLPDELKRTNPLLHVHHAGLLYNNAMVEPAIDELLQTRRELEAGDRQANRAALGEVCCMLGIISLGMADCGFVEQFKKAGEYLPNGSLMINSNGAAVNTRYAIMLKSPDPGELKRMEAAMFSAMPMASETMNGYAHGIEYLAAAEAAYFTGDMKRAAINAYEALYRAREKSVADVAASGYFLLMRIEAANGNYKGVLSNLEQMRGYVSGLNDKWNFNGMPDVAEAWFNLLMGSSGKVADWLLDDVLGSSVLAPYSMGMERSIKARCLLRQDRHYELLAWLGQTEKPIRQYGLWLILLEILICKAIALHQVQDMEQAAAALEEAYEISHGNGIIMQFVELGSDIRSVIYSVKRGKLNNIPEAWLDEIYTKAATYDKHGRNMRLQHQTTAEPATQPSVKLTKRENEMLGYLCQGLTNMDIASTCFITVSAVKKSLNNVYIKLGATNRADAVRIALQKGLCS